MTTLYLIDLSVEPVGNANFDGVPGHYISHLKAWGVLVPVEPCSHGNYATHIIPGTAMLGERFGESFVAAHQWCPGSPDPETTDNQQANHPAHGKGEWVGQNWCDECVPDNPDHHHHDISHTHSFDDVHVHDVDDLPGIEAGEWSNRV